MGLFQTVIFALHLGAAVMVTALWYARQGCDVVSRMYVDSWERAPNSTALWVRDGFDEACYGGEFTSACFREGLPIYEVSTGLGWHLLALLAHFEWISAGFALYYIRSDVGLLQPVLAGALPILGALLCTPYRDSFPNETFLMWFNSLGSAAILWSYTKVMGGLLRYPVGNPGAPLGRWDGGEKDGVWVSLLPVLRFCEYCFSASELIVALSGVFVVDPPLFIPVMAYVGILACNLSGVVLHLAVVANSDVRQRLGSHGRLQVPRHWLREGAGEALLEGGGTTLVERTKKVLRAYEYDWSNRESFLNTGLGDSWIAFAVALCMVCYQAQLLFSRSAPGFVVASGWILLLSYTSFGLWVTAMYLTTAPRVLLRCCSCVGTVTDTELMVAGLDVLSVNAKLGIVLSLTAGFVFMPGAC